MATSPLPYDRQPAFGPQVPITARLATMRPGRSPSREARSKPHRSRRSGVKLAVTTSAVAISWAASSRPASVSRLRVTARLFGEQSLNTPLVSTERSPGGWGPM